MPLIPRPFLFLRHGQTDWNRDGRAMGQRDIPLNATGLAQAAAARDALRDQTIGAIFASPLARARVTAEIVNQTLDRPLFIVPDLAEVRWGMAEGRRRGDWEARWRTGEPIAGAETLDAFLNRAIAAINDILAAAEDRFGAPPLIVAHGGIYWSVQRALRLPFPSDLPNAVPICHQPGPRWQITPLPVAGPAAAGT